ncbi:MAG: SUF system NifU family Fe-S cluster assembly protein [Pirellulales bacterium]|nr:SUF system NifU family Fe-S cluster assembly protein [Pirellulales bacterium]
MDNEIYQERILDHYENPRHCGACEHKTHAFSVENPLCGDRITIELEVDADERIRDARFKGDGCCVSQAAASMLLEQLIGKTVQEAATFSSAAMLELFGPRLTATRQRCCLLAWRGLKLALANDANGDQEAA